MVATSFEDAWNDNSPSFQNGPAPNQMQDAQRGRHEQPVQPVQPVQAASVSAKNVTIQDAAEAVVDRESVLSVRLSDDMVEDATSREILQELKDTRREAQKRATVFVVVACILFALLFIYIDRLQQQIRMLNTFLCHRQIPTIASISQDVHRGGGGRSSLW